MKVLIFGATGMVGQGVLRECLAASDVDLVQTIGRTPTGQQHPKLRELVHADMTRYDKVEAELQDIDACFFCLGVSSTKMSESDYTRVTHDLTLAAAEALVRFNPRMVFIYLSGAGADQSGQSKTMWERVRGGTEKALLALPFKAVYIFRPGMIQPLDGIKSKTPSYRLFYSLTKPLLPAMRKLFPKEIVSTRQMGQAMLNAVRRLPPKRVLERADIAALGG
ncbi:MAG TPA: NAD-dependent epimerase/dehydratase family protein [Telluria sp.]